MSRRRSVAAVERDIRALELRRRGLSYEQIASQMEWKSTSTAYEAVQRALGEAASEAVDELRAIEGARLDELTRILHRVIARDHYVVASGTGELVRDPRTKRPLIDDGPIVQAVLALLRVSERRSRLNGLDAPVQHEISMAWLEAQIAVLEVQVAHVGGSQAGPLALPPGPSKAPS